MAELLKLVTDLDQHLLESIWMDHDRALEAEFLFDLPFGSRQGDAFFFEKLFETENDFQVFLTKDFLAGGGLPGVEEIELVFPILDDFRIQLGDPADLIQAVHELICVFLCSHAISKGDAHHP